ncbi:ABC transporter permease [Mycobacterium sp. CVI_P3]|uniref:ABC transporter permease n=1 Tax=Mycobacterium pinniadriaticum TaxID=2994102 RepID=A0ABT3SHH9_9MYCO|nr:ABC transporter permease [Mycobacterium pinniadriaticum]MCX2932571.1 ABC transporter permease [Mycobacterium pinniadriaticum]MCX2938985.1 ABC transporter permease [Mycobacterium pinniadriaticum]
MTAVTALTERVVHTAVRDFDLALGVLVPVGTLLGLNGALRNVIDTGAMSYAEYLVPAIIVQAMLLGAVTSADRAGREQSSGLTFRLRTHPISLLAPMIARITYCLLRGVLSLAAALAVGYLLLGFRLTGGFGCTVAFVAIPLCLTLAISLGADATGTRLRRIGGTQLLLMPQLILILVSTGLAPAEAFPNWVQAFVRHQPVSQVTETIRGLAVGDIAGAQVAITAAWCLGLLLVLAPIAVHLQRRPL